MTIEISAFRWVPPVAQGYVKDLRLRWALEEAGLPYRVVLVDPEIQGTPSYRRWQPFGQVPAYRDAEMELFESGAILLRIASLSGKLAPADAAGRARVTAWVFAALNSIEPYAQNLIQLAVFHRDEDWAQARLPFAAEILDARLAALSTWLDGRQFLEGPFGAADIAMSMVLRELVDCGALAKFPAVDAYRERCTARPAFARALEAQLRTFRENAPA